LCGSVAGDHGGAETNRTFRTTPSTNFPNNTPLHYRHFTPETLRTLVAETGGLDIIYLEGYGDIAAERSF